jgi:hypothetical protein
VDRRSRNSGRFSAPLYSQRPARTRVSESVGSGSCIESLNAQQYAEHKRTKTYIRTHTHTHTTNPYHGIRVSALRTVVQRRDKTRSDAAAARARARIALRVSITQVYQ